MEQPSDLERRVSRGTRVALQTVLVSTVLGMVKIAAGVLGHSYALIADGIESILDIFGSLVVWGGLRIAATPPDRKHPYGHGKAEPLAAMVVAVGLLAVALGLAIQCVREIFVPRHTPAPFTLAVLLLVVVTKELLYRRLERTARETHSTSLEVDAWHHRSDALTSAAAFLGISMALVGGEGFETADVWAALVACGIIGYNGGRLLRSAASEIMDIAAPESVERSIRKLAAGVPGVLAVEKCRTRKSGPGWFVDIHLEVDGALPIVEGHALGHRVKDLLCRADLGIIDVLAHVEPGAPETPSEDGRED